MRLWDLHSASPDESQVLQGHKSPVRFAEISPDSRWAATADDEGQVIVWDLESSSHDSMWVLEAHRGKIHDLAVSSDSRWLAVGGTGAFEAEDNSVRLWDIKSLSWPDDVEQSTSVEERVASPGFQPFILRGHHGPVLSVAITPDCRWVVTEAKTRRSVYSI